MQLQVMLRFGEDFIQVTAAYEEIILYRIKQPIFDLRIWNFTFLNQLNCFCKKTTVKNETCKNCSNWSKKLRKFGFLGSELVVVGSDEQANER